MVTATSPWALCDGGGMVFAPGWASAVPARSADSRIKARIGTPPSWFRGGSYSAAVGSMNKVLRYDQQVGLLPAIPAIPGELRACSCRIEARLGSFPVRLNRERAWFPLFSVFSGSSDDFHPT